MNCITFNVKIVFLIAREGMCFGNEVKFYLLGSDYFFNSKIGDVLLLKSRDLYHCSRSYGTKG